MEDFPNDKFSGVLELIRYSKKDQYLTIEHRYVNNLTEKNISREKAQKDFSYDEIAVNNKDIKKLRNFLNSLKLDGDEQ